MVLEKKNISMNNIKIILISLNYLSESFLKKIFLMNDIKRTLI